MYPRTLTVLFALLLCLLCTLAAKNSVAQNNADSQMTADERYFLGLAAQYYDWKCDNAAAKSLYLNALCDPAALETYSFDWYPGISVPRHFLRIGIGVTYQAKDYDGPILLVGSTEPAGGRGGSRGGDPDGLLGPVGTGPGATGQGATAEPEADEQLDGREFLQKYGGEFTDKLLKELDKRRKRSSGNFGRVLRAIENVKYEVVNEEGEAETNDAGDEVDEEKTEERQEMTLGGGRNIPAIQAPGKGAGIGGKTEGKDDEEKEELEAEEEKKGADNTPTGKESEKKAPVNNTTIKLGKIDQLTEEFRTIEPGIVCLYEGSNEELVERANRQGVDVLFVINIIVRETRGVHYSLSGVRLIDLKNEGNKIIAQTKALRHDEDMTKEIGKSSMNPVEFEIDKLMGAFDNGFVSQELPAALNAENVGARVERIITGAESSGKLPVAVEILAFHRKGFLTEEATAKALDRLYDGSGNLLLKGQPADRIEFLKKLMAESL